MRPAAGNLVSASFDLALAAVFLLTWIEPGSAAARPAGLLVLVMLLEFITVHSSAMLGSTWAADEPRAKRLKQVGLMTGAYALLVGAFSAGFGTWTPFVAFWVLSANRLAGMLLGGRPGPVAKREAERSWARSVVLYLAGASVTLFVPVPRLGLTPQIMEGVDIAGSGLWVDEPWRVLAFGAFYFGLGGVLLLRDVVKGRTRGSGVAPGPIVQPEGAD